MKVSNKASRRALHKVILGCLAACIFLPAFAYAVTVTYYVPSGNIETITDDGTVYTFIDEDYWGIEPKQGRLLRIDYSDGGYISNTYYGNTRNISHRENRWGVDGDVYINEYYDEE